MEKLDKLKKIVITGGSGQVGSKLKELTDSFPAHIYYPSSLELNLEDNLSVTQYLNKISPHLIVNLAAYTDVDRSEVDMSKAKSINSNAVKVIADYCCKNNIGIIHLSTDYVFDNQLEPHKPFSKKNPLNFYGLTKSLGEDSIINSTHNYLIIRTASVFSDIGKNFVRTMLKLILDDQKIRVIHNQKISLTYAGDIANFVFYFIKVYFSEGKFNKLKNKIIHFTNKGFTTWSLVARSIYDEVINLNIDTKAELFDIDSDSWVSEAQRSNDSRLWIDENWLEENFEIFEWKDRVKKVISDLIPLIKKELNNEKK